MSDFVTDCGICNCVATECFFPGTWLRHKYIVSMVQFYSFTQCTMFYLNLENMKGKTKAAFWSKTDEPLRSKIRLSWKFVQKKWFIFASYWQESSKKKLKSTLKTRLHLWLFLTSSLVGFFLDLGLNKPVLYDCAAILHPS